MEKTKLIAKKIVKVCPECSKEFNARIKTQIFCSRLCYWNSGRITTVCAGCGKEITIDKNKSKNGGNRHFCSRECAYHHFEKPTNPVESTCTYCGKPLKRQRGRSNMRAKHHFCNRECDNAWRRNGGNPSGENHPEYNSVQVKCDNCNQPITRQSHRLEYYNHQFCTRACYGEWRSRNINETKHPRWKGHSTKAYRGPNITRQSARARRRDGFKCRKCGVSQSDIGQKLDIHHLIPFKDFNYIPGTNDNYKQANRLSNLVSLCRSCHMALETTPYEDAISCLTPTPTS